MYSLHQKKQPQSATLKERKGEVLEAKMFEIVKECSKYQRVEDRIKVLEDKVYPMLATQTGSRYFQKQLNEEEGGGKEGVAMFIEFVFSEVGDKINELMVDNHASINYFIQELIRKCNANQRLAILQNISEDFVKI